MNKFMAWDNENNRAIYPENADWQDFFIQPDGTVAQAYISYDYDDELFRQGFCDFELFESTGKTDIHGNEIYYNFHVVKFKFNDPQLKKVINCIGVFGFNKDELRAEIDIYNNPHMPCLWYLVDDMSDFEIIGNIKENPELIGEGK